jgi:hypothetical protein
MNTGPSKPDGNKGVVATNLRMLVSVNRFSGGNPASPISRLGRMALS